MKSYYWLADTGELVDPDLERNLSYEEASSVLSVMHAPGSYIGLYLKDDQILQMRREDDGTIWLEFLDPIEKTAIGSIVSVPIAEAALDLSFKHIDVRQQLDDQFFLRWTRIDLDR